MEARTVEFAVSARAKPAALPIRGFLALHFGAIPVKSVFGFCEYTTLYGGRGFVAPELTDADIAWMYDNGIGYRIPLQNVLATYDDYKENKAFLRKYHRAGNSLILVRRELATWIRNDFPLYETEASVISQIATHEKIAAALPLFDVVVVHPRMNEDAEFLGAIAEKDRIRLFANAGCMVHCPTMECYASFSRLNKQMPGAEFHCAQRHIPEYAAEIAGRTGMIEYDVAKLNALGFTRFKKLSSKGKTGN